MLSYPQTRSELCVHVCVNHQPTFIQLGDSILHFCLCRRLMASHRGTCACMEGLKGPKSPCKHEIGHHISNYRRIAILSTYRYEAYLVFREVWSNGDQLLFCKKLHF